MPSWLSKAQSNTSTFRLVHGLEDSTVPFTQSYRAMQQLKGMGADARLVLRPAGDHQSVLIEFMKGAMEEMLREGQPRISKL